MHSATLFGVFWGTDQDAVSTIKRLFFGRRGGVAQIEVGPEGNVSVHYKDSVPGLAGTTRPGAAGCRLPKLSGANHVASRLPYGC